MPRRSPAELLPPVSNRHRHGCRAKRGANGCGAAPAGSQYSIAWSSFVTWPVSCWAGSPTCWVRLASTWSTGKLVTPLPQAASNAPSGLCAAVSRVCRRGGEAGWRRFRPAAWISHRSRGSSGPLGPLPTSWSSARAARRLAQNCRARRVTAGSLNSRRRPQRLAGLSQPVIFHGLLSTCSPPPDDPPRRSRAPACKATYVCALASLTWAGSRP